MAKSRQDSALRRFCPIVILSAAAGAVETRRANAERLDLMGQNFGFGFASALPRKACVFEDLTADDGSAAAPLGEAAGQLADVGVVAALAFLVGGIVVAADKAEDGKSTTDTAIILNTNTFTKI